MQNISFEFFAFIRGYLVRFKLIYDKQVAVFNVVNSIIYKEILTPFDTEKYLATVVNMYILVGILCVGIVKSEAFILACIFNCFIAMVKHLISQSQYSLKQLQ